MRADQAYAIIGQSPRTITGSLAHKIYFKFRKTPTSQIVRALNSNKENVDDETFELIERCKAACLVWKFDDNDKVMFDVCFTVRDNEATE